MSVDWDWTLTPTDASLKIEVKGWRWFTAALTRTMIPGTKEEDIAEDTQDTWGDNVSECFPHLPFCDMRMYFDEIRGDCGRTNPDPAFYDELTRWLSSGLEYWTTTVIWMLKIWWGRFQFNSNKSYLSTAFLSLLPQLTQESICKNRVTFTD